MRNETLGVLGITYWQAYEQAFCCESTQVIPVHHLRWLSPLVFSGWRTRVLRKHFAQTRCKFVGRVSGNDKAGGDPYPDNKKGTPQGPFGISNGVGGGT